MLLLFLLLGGCDDPEDSAPPADTQLPFVDSSSGCELVELACDGVDDDCDGLVDEGLLVTFFQDEDGDGVGGEVSEERCPTGLAGWSLRQGDCDDTNRTISPDASELCNGVDDNCDGQVDEGLVPPDWFMDQDGDGYGVEPAVPACTQPEGHSSRDGDCDDSRDDVNPSAFEDCGDEVDNDCDGAVDDVSQCCISTVDGTDRYLLCNDAVPWDQARAACEIDGWSLVVVNDANENEFLADLALWQGSGFWLGLTDAAAEGTWLTVHGTAPPWYGWKDSEPNNSTATNADGQDCAGFVTSTNAWHDLDCLSPVAFVCEQ